VSGGTEQYIAAIDQGTTSTRCILFDRAGRPTAVSKEEHRQYFPKPGWVEHDPAEILRKTGAVVEGALAAAGATGSDLAAVGITNQRETVVAWDRETGVPYCNAIVWQDTRTSDRVAQLAAETREGSDRFRGKTGLPLATYFSATKIEWILRNQPGVRKAAEAGRAVFGTIDAWLVWNLTGGPDGGTLVTDATNASRTMLMDLAACRWDPGQLEVFGIPAAALPRIVPSTPSGPYGYTLPNGPFGAKVPVAGILGDQQAALFGQACFEPGDSKNTYGTGCFLLQNTGEEIIGSKHGLISTVACAYGDADGGAMDRVTYALEGSVAVAGALVQWLRDNLGLIGSSSEIETLARSVDDSGGVYFVPAFSGLFAPYWRTDARGVIAGLTGYVNKGHLARAVLEATAFQSRELIDAMAGDSGLKIPELKVDGGMTANGLLMQFQADLLDIPVVRPVIPETTALGAAYAAGLAVGFWEGRGEIASQWLEDTRWRPSMSDGARRERIEYWKKAVERTMEWIPTT
jgi:glycerol kinase